MERVDRLVWADGIALTLRGLRIGIRLSDPAVRSRLLPALPSQCEPTDDPRVPELYSLIVGGDGAWRGARRFNLLYDGGRLVRRSMDLDTVLSALEHDLGHRLALRAGVRLWAAAVSWNGQAVLFPGPPGTGRSTLVSALAELGASVLARKSVVVDLDGEVRPYVSAAVPDGDLPWQPLGVLAAMPSLPVRAVVFTQYREGARLRPTRLTSSQGAIRLMQSAHRAQEEPRETMAAVRRIAETAVFLRGVRGEAADAARLLAERVFDGFA